MRNFYKGKKVFITGHTGFKGAWLAQMLLQLESEVQGYSLTPPTTPNLYDTLQLKRHLKSNTLADVRDFQALHQAMREGKPDLVFHLAAQPLVRDSYDNPRGTYETNVMGTVNVLEAMRLNQIKAGVMITTDKVYKNLEDNRAFKEEDPLGGYDPYSNSKACADLSVMSYVHSFFNPDAYQKTHQTLVASARAGNVVGGGDWSKDRLIPDLIKAIFERKEDLAIRNPAAVRPWQHVLEPLVGYLILGQALYEGQKEKFGAWNFGPEEESMVSVQTLLDLCLKSLGRGHYRVQNDFTKHEAQFLRLNISKAKKELGWIPRMNITDAIRQTMEWYKNFYDRPNQAIDFTNQQILRYFEH